jgi:hypothetical protein
MEKIRIDDLLSDPTFKFGTLSGRDVGAAQGHMPAVTCWPSGRLLFNVGSSKAMRRVTTAADLDIKECGVVFAVDEAKMLVAIYPVRLGTTGADPVRLVKNTELVALHLKGVLAEFPQFRSTQTLLCPVFPHKDADGKHCLILSIQTAVPKIKRSRPAKEDDASKGETTKGTTKETAKETTAKETVAPDTAAEAAKVVEEVAPAATSTTTK